MKEGMFVKATDSFKESTIRSDMDELLPQLIHI